MLTSALYPFCNSQCRTYDISPAEFPGLWHDGMSINRTGVVTTIHLTDLGIEGTLASMGPAFCPLVHLRELDLDGSHLTGELPRWIADCFPHLKGACPLACVPLYGYRSLLALTQAPYSLRCCRAGPVVQPP